MNLREALHILAPTFTQATRGDRQRIIETALAEFCPDGVEASELLDALQAGLKERYGDDRISDVLHVMRTLHWALKELDETSGPETEQDIREFLADQDQGYDNEEGDWK
jgi:hypothetical protein